jgi:hypothetical protein
VQERAVTLLTADREKRSSPRHFSQKEDITADSEYLKWFKISLDPDQLIGSENAGVSGQGEEGRKKTVPLGAMIIYLCTEPTSPFSSSTNQQFASSRGRILGHLRKKS